MRIRKALWFGFTLMAIILSTVLVFTPWAGFFDGHLSRDDLGALATLDPEISSQFLLEVTTSRGRRVRNSLATVWIQQHRVEIK